MKTKREKINASDGFLKMLGVSKKDLKKVVKDALRGAQDGELFLQKLEASGLVWNDGRIESSSFYSDEGFGLRRVEGMRTGYVSSDIITVESIKKSGEELREVFAGGKMYASAKKFSPQPLYPQEIPAEIPIEEKIALLEKVDAYVRSKDPRVTAVSVSLSQAREEVCIARADGLFLEEFRPMVRMNISLTLVDGANIGTGFEGFGGRENETRLFTEWQGYADRAIECAKNLLVAEDCPAGEMAVVFGPGWPAVILHEAFGHMLEGDHIFKNTSAFVGMMGEQIAAEGVTIVDEGSILGRRGSLSFDDEGTKTERTVLVKDGVLAAYLHDRLSARVLGAKPTGNGRRESYAHIPMPRMTNTHMLGGTHTPEEIIAATENGLYAGNMSGGQVDITTGKFVFEVLLAWRIENGNLTVPVKGAMLTGSGEKVFRFVDMVGNDPALDNGIGACGKNGQFVPVGVGQPTIRIRAGGLIVGGTEMNVTEEML
jgi:TldD protein